MNTTHQEGLPGSGHDIVTAVVQPGLKQERKDRQCGEEGPTRLDPTAERESREGFNQRTPGRFCVPRLLCGNMEGSLVSDTPDEKAESQSTDD